MRCAHRSVDRYLREPSFEAESARGPAGSLAAANHRGYSIPRSVRSGESVLGVRGIATVGHAGDAEKPPSAAAGTCQAVPLAPTTGDIPPGRSSGNPAASPHGECRIGPADQPAKKAGTRANRPDARAVTSANANATRYASSC